ncbi:MAG: AMP-binding protein [Rhodobacteraceae bacterium]|nr:AMP-binding protein [Paracoccaceae bacterium]
MKFKWHQASVLSGKNFFLNADEIKKQLSIDLVSWQLPEQPFVAINLDRNPVSSIINLFRAVEGNYCFRLTPKPFPKGENIKADHCSHAHDPSGSPPCFVVQTGGTTGPLKKILRLQSTWINSFLINREIWSITSRDNFGILGDLTHSISLYGLLEGLYLGTNVTLLGEWLPKSQLEEIATRKISILYATPIQLQLLTRAFEIHKLKPITSLRKIIVGGSKLTPNHVLKLKNLFPKGEIIEFYGTAETSFITIATTDSPQGSVGKAYEGVKIRVLNDRGEALPTGKIGNIEVTSPYVFEGYIDNGTLNPIQNDYFQTGERGFLDQNGYLFLKGRRDRMISIHDVNVHPEEVENFLTTIKGIEAAYVYSSSNRFETNHLHACLFINSFKPDINQVSSMCRRELGPNLTPKSYRLIDEKPPLLASGKLNFTAIQKLLETA